MTAYTLKQGMENGEPAHYLCASCYHEGHKSIMQTETRSPGRCEVMVCHRCGSDLYIRGIRQPEHHAMKRPPRG
jgi:NMD protein affecting ribosome stability and mRNA decay